MFKDLISTFSNTRVFLIQGNESVFENLSSEIVSVSPFVFSLSTARFNYDNAGTLSEYLLEGNGEKRYAIVFFSVFSPESAQRLLKSFEEPDLDTTVFMITQYPYTIPATIRSRAQIINNFNSKKESIYKIGNRSEMLDLIKKDFSTESEDASIRRAKAIALLDSLENYLFEKKEKSDIVYEGKKMLFKANMPTKFVLDYVFSTAL